MNGPGLPDEDDSARAQEALASPFQTYCYPLYAYLRHGYNEHDAEDLVQAFCLHLQESLGEFCQDCSGLSFPLGPCGKTVSRKIGSSTPRFASS